MAAVAGEIQRTTSGYTFDKNHLKRASEIGGSLKKLSKRDAKEAAKLIKLGGGVKKLSDGKARVPKKTKSRIIFGKKN